MICADCGIIFTDFSNLSEEYCDDCWEERIQDELWDSEDFDDEENTDNF